ncbi:hypothetical protein BKA61DRAFT_674819 [Leptodontidium sp. MPI-SDFR-AT-0119]|nr:hypothetical protein BKA61DRAFT_674819 [Leptodontidium sp. MPI-SDFR-AT-0119]
MEKLPAQATIGGMATNDGGMDGGKIKKDENMGGTCNHSPEPSDTMKARLLETLNQPGIVGNNGTGYDEKADGNPVSSSREANVHIPTSSLEMATESSSSLTHQQQTVPDPTPQSTKTQREAPEDGKLNDEYLLTRARRISDIDHDEESQKIHRVSDSALENQEEGPIHHYHPSSPQSKRDTPEDACNSDRADQENEPTVLSFKDSTAQDWDNVVSTNSRNGGSSFGGHGWGSHQIVAGPSTDQDPTSSTDTLDEDHYSDMPALDSGSEKYENHSCDSSEERDLLQAIERSLTDLPNEQPEELSGYGDLPYHPCQHFDVQASLRLKAVSDREKEAEKIVAAHEKAVQEFQNKIDPNHSDYDEDVRAALHRREKELYFLERMEKGGGECGLGSRPKQNPQRTKDGADKKPHQNKPKEEPAAWRSATDTQVETTNGNRTENAAESWKGKGKEVDQANQGNFTSDLQSNEMTETEKVAIEEADIEMAVEASLQGCNGLRERSGRRFSYQDYEDQDLAEGGLEASVVDTAPVQRSLTSPLDTNNPPSRPQPVDGESPEISSWKHDLSDDDVVGEKDDDGDTRMKEANGNHGEQSDGNPEGDRDGNHDGNQNGSRDVNSDANGNQKGETPEAEDFGVEESEADDKDEDTDRDDLASFDDNTENDYGWLIDPNEVIAEVLADRERALSLAPLIERPSSPLPELGLSDDENAKSQDIRVEFDRRKLEERLFNLQHHNGSICEVVRDDDETALLSESSVVSPGNTATLGADDQEDEDDHYNKSSVQPETKNDNRRQGSGSKEKGKEVEQDTQTSECQATKQSPKTTRPPPAHGDSAHNPANGKKNTNKKSRWQRRKEKKKRVEEETNNDSKTKASQSSAAEEYPANSKKNINKKSRWQRRKENKKLRLEEEKNNSSKKKASQSSAAEGSKSAQDTRSTKWKSKAQKNSDVLAQDHASGSGKNQEQLSKEVESAEVERQDMMKGVDDEVEVGCGPSSPTIASEAAEQTSVDREQRFVERLGHLEDVLQGDQVTEAEGQKGGVGENCAAFVFGQPGHLADDCMSVGNERNLEVDGDKVGE